MNDSTAPSNEMQQEGQKLRGQEQIMCAGCDYKQVDAVWCPLCEEYEPTCEHRFCETKGDHYAHQRTRVRFDPTCAECYRLKEVAKLRGKKAAEQFEKAAVSQQG